MSQTPAAQCVSAARYVLRFRLRAVRNMTGRTPERWRLAGSGDARGWFSDSGRRRHTTFAPMRGERGRPPRRCGLAPGHAAGTIGDVNAHTNAQRRS